MPQQTASKTDKNTCNKMLRKRKKEGKNLRFSPGISSPAPSNHCTAFFPFPRIGGISSPRQKGPLVTHTAAPIFYTRTPAPLSARADSTPGGKYALLSEMILSAVFPAERLSPGKAALAAKRTAIYNLLARGTHVPNIHSSAQPETVTTYKINLPSLAGSFATYKTARLI